MSPEERASPSPEAPVERKGWGRLRYFVVHNILHLDDSPHRIAHGVFWGFVVGATPAVGLQTVMYLAIATLLGANRVSGIGPVWITNPVTIVPIYYFNWRVGTFLVTGTLETSAASREAIAHLFEGEPGSGLGVVSRFVSVDFWLAVWELIASAGLELWIGSLFVGVISGAFGYAATYRAVVAYRRRRHPAPES